MCALSSNKTINLLTHLEEVIRPIVEIDAILVLEDRLMDHVVGLQGSKTREALGKVGIKMRSHVGIKTLDLTRGGAVIDRDGPVESHKWSNSEQQPRENNDDQNHGTHQSDDGDEGLVKGAPEDIVKRVHIATESVSSKT